MLLQVRSPENKRVEVLKQCAQESTRRQRSRIVVVSIGIRRQLSQDVILSCLDHRVLDVCVLLNTARLLPIRGGFRYLSLLKRGWRSEWRDGVGR